MPAKKAKKKIVTKSRKKTAKKHAVKKKTVKKKPVAKKKAAKKTSRRATPALRKTTPVKQEATVEPGPPPREIPPVEEPAAHETAIGTVTHYYSHLGVAIVQINASAIEVGDRIHILGHTTDLTQTVESMEYEHSHIDRATPGQSVGIRIQDHAREHDIVYLVK